MTEVKFTIDIETDMMTIAKGVADSNCLDAVKHKSSFAEALSTAFHDRHKDSMGHCNFRIWNVDPEDVEELKAQIVPPEVTALAHSVRKRMEDQYKEQKDVRYAYIGSSEMKQFQDAIDLVFGVRLGSGNYSGHKYDYSYEFNRMIECLDEIGTNGYGTRLDQDIINDLNTNARRKFKRGRFLKKDAVKGDETSAYTINVDALAQDHADLMDGINVLPTIRLSKEEGENEFQMNRLLPDGTEEYMWYPKNLFAAVNELGSMLKRREAGAIKQAIKNAEQGRDLREENGFYTEDELAFLLQGVELPEQQTYAVIDTGKPNEYSCSRVVTDAESQSVVEELFAAGRNPRILVSGVTHAIAQEVEVKHQRSAQLATKQKSVCDRITALREKLEELVSENKKLSEAKTANIDAMMEIINERAGVAQ